MIIPLISLGMFFSVIKSFYFDYAFQLSGATRNQVYAVLVAAIVNVICNMLLIPLYGILGAALSTVGAFLFALIISVVLGLKSFPMPKIAVRPFLTIIISSVVMSVFTMFDLSSDLRINLAFKIVISILTYVACLILANFLDVRVRLKSMAEMFFTRVFR